MKFNYWMIIGMTILKVLDILTTVFFLHLDGIIESNPLWYEYENNPILILILSFWLIFIMLALTLIFRKRKFILQGIAGLFSIYTITLIYVVFNNIYLITVYI